MAEEMSAAMPKKAKINQILTRIWRNLEIRKTKFYDWISTTNNFLAKLEHRIIVVFDPNFGGAYTTITRSEKNLRIIKIGGGLVQKIVGFDDEVTKKEVYDNIKNIIFAVVGLDYHEMGHNLDTDMSSRLIVEYPKPEYIDFMHNIFNIVEDFHVEKYIANYVEEHYPDYIQPRRCFNYIINKIFEPQAKEYKDNGDVGSFMQYLLLLVRVGKKKIANTNAIFEKYQDELVKRYSECLGEPHPTKRLEKVIAFCEWMIDTIKELDFSTARAPEKKLSGSMPAGEKPYGEPIKVKPTDGISVDDIEKALTDGEFEEEDKEEESKEEEKESAMIDEKSSVDLDADFDESIAAAADHIDVYAKDEFLISDPSLYGDIETIIANMQSTVCEVENVIKLFEARKAPRDVVGFTKGRLDSRAAVQNAMKGGCNLKVFSRPIPRGKKRSLAVCCVGDNSGSMEGRKSEICSTAMLTLGEVCDATRTPAKFCCFTKDYDGHLGGNITIIEKDFEDSFQDSKPYFGINSSSLIHKLESINKVPTFRGNSEEINIHYIGEDFKKRPEEIKLMFVICDGATTGSRTLLSSNIEKLEKDGIIVIGIGVQTNIESLYSQSKTFSSIEDLRANLGNYLIEKLSEYALR